MRCSSVVMPGYQDQGGWNQGTGWNQDGDWQQDQSGWNQNPGKGKPNRRRNKGSWKPKDPEQTKSIDEMSFQELVDAVKNYQRSSWANKQYWEDHVQGEDGGAGTRDPARHEQTFLTTL